MRVMRKTGETHVIKSKPNNKGTIISNSTVVSWLKDDPKHILMALDPTDQKPGIIAISEHVSTKIHKVNVNTGKRKLYSNNRKRFDHIVFDRQGNMRVGVVYSFEKQ